jgi:hypothetical protein
MGIRLIAPLQGATAIAQTAHQDIIAHLHTVAHPAIVILQPNIISIVAMGPRAIVLQLHMAAIAHLLTDIIPTPGVILSGIALISSIRQPQTGMAILYLIIHLLPAIPKNLPLQLRHYHLNPNLSPARIFLRPLLFCLLTDSDIATRSGKLVIIAI